MAVAYAKSREREARWIRGLHRVEARPVRTLTATYRDALVEIQASIDGLVERLAVAQEAAAGNEVIALTTRLQLLENRRASIVADIRRILGDSPLAQQATFTLQHAVPQAYQHGVVAGLTALDGLVVNPERLNPEFAQRAIARLTGQTNANEWVRRLAGDNAERVINTLTRGVLVGHGPVEMVRQVRGSLAATEPRVATFVRTEIIGAARMGNLDLYRANADVVTGWVWNADDTACAVCWAENGSLHTLDEELESHPNCRCSADPTTAPMDDLAAGTAPTDGSVGATPFDPNERFAQLPAGQQMRVLGPSRLQAFNDGNLDLRDIPARTRHPMWGPGKRAKSLRELGIHR